MGAYSIVDTLLLIAAGFVAVGGVLALYLSRGGRKNPILPAPGVRGLSSPTRAVIGVAMVVGAYHLAAPVFGWSGVRGPMGIIGGLALVAAVGSVYLDAVQRRDAPEQGDGEHQ